jgi:hypothetical protein
MLLFRVSGKYFMLNGLESEEWIASVFRVEENLTLKAEADHLVFFADYWWSL